MRISAVKITDGLRSCVGLRLAFLLPWGICKSGFLGIGLNLLFCVPFFFSPAATYLHIQFFLPESSSFSPAASPSCHLRFPSPIPSYAILYYCFPGFTVIFLYCACCPPPTPASSLSLPPNLWPPFSFLYHCWTKCTLSNLFEIWASLHVTVGRDDGGEGVGGSFSEILAFSKILDGLWPGDQTDPSAGLPTSGSCVLLCWGHILDWEPLVMKGRAVSQALSCLPLPAAAAASWLFSSPEL